MLYEALEAQRALEAEVERHVQAQRDLDNLYDSIFQGFTPGFPEEDTKENELNSALQAYHGARVQFECESSAVQILSQAQHRMTSALHAIENALDHSRMDMFGGSFVSDMMERNELHKCEMDVSQAQMLVIQAQRMSPTVGNLPPVKIAQGSLMSDVLFDNIFTDAAFHDKIKDSRLELQRCARVLDQQLNAARGRQQELGLTVRGKTQVLDTARAELQEARQSIFETVA
ncbi:uncharacterized protein BCR38DRAFT_428298 [Pseudomassariella vexata]|uniref:Uncharacterized protein n=1 Tax=Pseudomassariella vexata TaxID=1141098 RepID=A0A1Y2E2T9_9PEZI|nr:uncharacterized protein BCR38DRAFT_428298 [Pseudomassariella vexata]ORY65767.1 hypothetical protein BCR38DRAFT_428298 [Pseudomassariella vexata]